MPTAINLNENRFDVHYGVNRDEKTRVGRRGARREREDDKTNDPSRIQQYLLR